MSRRCDSMRRKPRSRLSDSSALACGSSRRRSSARSRIFSGSSFIESPPPAACSLNHSLWHRALAAHPSRDPSRHAGSGAGRQGAGAAHTFALLAWPLVARQPSEAARIGWTQSPLADARHSTLLIALSLSKGGSDFLTLNATVNSLASHETRSHHAAGNSDAANSAV